MTFVTLKLADDTIARLTSLAEREGISVEDFILRLVETVARTADETSLARHGSLDTSR